MLSAINSYINPFSLSFKESIQKFHKLDGRHKAAAIFASIIPGLLTFGFGGLATFKKLTDVFHASLMNKTNPKVVKVDSTAQNIFIPPSPVKAPAKSTSPSLPKAEDSSLGTQESLNIDTQELNDREFVKRIARPMIELSNKPDNTIEEIEAGISNQIKILGELVDQPELFVKAASIVSARNPFRSIGKTCEMLENCKWPSDSLKAEVLPQLVASLVHINAIAWDNVNYGYVKTTSDQGFSTNRILINLRKIVGDGYFSKDSISLSPTVAKGIGLVIQEIAKNTAQKLEEDLAVMNNLKPSLDNVYNIMQGLKSLSTQNKPLDGDLLQELKSLFVTLYKISDDGKIRHMPSEFKRLFTDTHAPLVPRLSLYTQIMNNKDKPAEVARFLNKLEASIQEFQKGIADGSYLRPGVEIAFGQSLELRFSAAMISPVLPYLKNVPGIVSIDFGDVGVSSPFEIISGVAPSTNGFGDADADALLDLFKAQPYLFQTKLSISGMSQDRAHSFIEDWKAIYKENAMRRLNNPNPNEFIEAFKPTSMIEGIPQPSETRSNGMTIEEVDVEIIDDKNN